jgi:succinate dehydrogenase/fumarate reductase cytochrome b subunit
MSIFLASGYTGGTDCISGTRPTTAREPPFLDWLGVLILLAINALISYTGFFGDKASLRTTHAYVGSGILALLLFHAALGIKLGISDLKFCQTKKHQFKSEAKL